MRISIALGLLVFSVSGSTRLWAVSHNITTIDVPGSNVFQTQATGINDEGEIVGFFYQASTGLTTHAFILRHGIFSMYFLSEGGTEFDGLNNRGDMVGLNTIIGTLFHNGQIISTISVPGAQQTFPRGINNSGQIVGTVDIPSGGLESFRLRGGNYSIFNVGGGANGINDAGDIVGTHGADGYFLRNGISSTIDFPGAPGTVLEGINDRGVIVGFYFDASRAGVTHGLILDRHGLSNFDVPGSTSTEISGINNRGDFVGNYVDSAGNVHGFLATPVKRETEGDGAAQSPAVSSSALAAVKTVQ